MSSENTSKNIATFSVIALILLGIAGYLFYQNTQLRKEIAQNDAEYLQLEEVNSQLDSEYQVAQKELNALKGDNEELNKLIDQHLMEIENQKNQIASMVGVNRDFEAAKNEISELKATVEQYLEEINQLKEENQQLTEENIALRTEKAELSDQVYETQNENQELLSERSALSSEKELLTEENTNLSKKVDKATMIPISNIDVKGYMTKENGREVRRRRAGNVEKLNVCFETEVNQLAEEGEEMYYVRIISPSGETIAVENAGSGVLTLTDTENQLQYSTVQKAGYEYKESEICLEWGPNIPFPEGTYIVEIYNKGYLAGSSTFKLR
ncbi:hypothetical protein [Membranihabitans maritimus]|uniref:hypothetical protein n=1 Tax=Membranihabitans maritimus TaxID=2904244 RepID=UPI001F23C468|nr:hypothetical protein [Membranihabitans maritimus]